MSNLSKIEGIGPAYAAKLEGAGVHTTDALLKTCSSPAGRRELAERTGISEKLVLRWANMADLFRIKGVSEEYAELLEHAGVDSVPELAQRKPENLLQKMTEANERKQLVRKLPGQGQVSGWIEQARNLPRTLAY